MIETLKIMETGEMLDMTDFVKDVGKMLSAIHQQSIAEFQSLVQVVFTLIIFKFNKHFEPILMIEDILFYKLIHKNSPHYETKLFGNKAKLEVDCNV